MKNLARLFLLGTALLGILILPAAAQEPGPGTGGPIIWPNFGGDIAGLNPLLVDDGPSHDVIDQILPDFLSRNPQTRAYEPGAPGSLVTDWTISEDGLTYTFTLRDDWNWSDGTPITSADVKYSFDAIRSGEISFSYESYLINVESLEAPDPHTIVVKFKQADCTAINALAVIPPVPAHVFTAQFPTFADMNQSEYNLNPTVTAGAFKFANFRPGEQVTLIADQSYPDTEFGFVIPEGFIYKNLENQTVVVDEFLAGNLTIIDSVPSDRRAEIRERAARGEMQIYEGPASGWMYIAFNLADPKDPKNGLDADGNPQDQGHHPIFGDLRVRQALMLGKDFDAINEGALQGTGIAVASPVIRTSWAFDPDLEPWPYDPEKAMALLDEAGWKDEDGNGIRECHGCLYAEEGTPLSFELTSFSGNTAVDAILVILQDQWKKIGVDMSINAVEFQTKLQIEDGQAFDASVGFIGGFDPSNPDEIRDIYAPIGDDLKGGFNKGSYYNPEFQRIMEEAKSLPGCDQEERYALYQQAQQILRDEAPWFWVYTTIVPVVAQNNVENWNPIPGYGDSSYNIPSWDIQLKP